MYAVMDNRRGGTSVEASRSFREWSGRRANSLGSMGVLTVYGYGFEEPKPEKPPTPWGAYLALALSAWWAWSKWFRKRGDGVS